VKARHAHKNEHGKAGNCARCRRLALLTNKRIGFFHGRLCRGCFKVVGFDPEAFARALAHVASLHRH
jgi:hypothetical protein